MKSRHQDPAARPDTPPTKWEPPTDHKPCTARTQRCNDARRYNRALADCCRQHIIDIAGTINDMCAREGIRWWIDYGSLLGAVRNPLMGIHPGIVPHDKDGDAGVLAEDWDRFLALSREVTKAGFFFQHKAPRPGPNLFRAGNSVKVCRSELNRTNWDFFPWFERDDGTMYRTAYVQVDRFKGREFPRFWLGDLPRVPFEGMMLPAPAEAEMMLAHRYGPGWRTPLMKNNDGRPR